MYDPKKEVSKTDWSEYATAYGVADKVPSLLMQLAGMDKAVAMAASHELWASLCHQHAFVSSAALPAYPILINILQESDCELAVEILDILTGFAVCTGSDAFEGPRPDWVSGLRRQMQVDEQVFVGLMSLPEDTGRDFAKAILSELKQSDSA